MSLFGSILHGLNALEISILTFVAYLLFYTMYDKTKKQLVPYNLVRILTLSDGLDKSLVEFNKALSLSGLSLLSMAFFPVFRREMWNLLWNAAVQLWVHALYSMYKYYGSKNIPYITLFLKMKEQSWKKVSILLGVSGQIILTAALFWYISLSKLATIGIICAICHFYTMEIDHKMVLRVRPFAYLVFPLAVIGVFYGFSNF